MIIKSLKPTQYVRSQIGLSMYRRVYECSTISLEAKILEGSLCCLTNFVNIERLGITILYAIFEYDDSK